MVIRLIFFISVVLCSVFSFTGVQAQTSILFCGGIEDDKPIGVSDRFYPDSASTYLYAFYQQLAPFNMKQIGMELYKKNGETFDLVGEKQLYAVKPKWKYTVVKCYFDAPGLYKVKLYDSNAQLLGEGIITIM